MDNGSRWLPPLANFLAQEIAAWSAFHKPSRKGCWLSPTSDVAQKKEAARKGGFRFLDNPEFGLEEDDSTNLEDVHVVETLVDHALSATNSVHADEINIDFLVLPPCEDVHGGRVDLLHRTETPTL